MKQLHYLKSGDVVLQHNLFSRLKDQGNFILPCSIGNFHNINALINSRASINLISLNIYRKLGLKDPKETSITLRLVMGQSRILKEWLQICLSKLNILSF